jgi:hypothetical protein
VRVGIVTQVKAYQAAYLPAAIVLGWWRIHPDVVSISFQPMGLRILGTQEQGCAQFLARLETLLDSRVLLRWCCVIYMKINGRLE